MLITGAGELSTAASVTTQQFEALAEFAKGIDTLGHQLLPLVGLAQFVVTDMIQTTLDDV